MILTITHTDENIGSSRVANAEHCPNPITNRVEHYFRVKKYLILLILALCSVSHAQEYWRLTQSFPGGAKTNLTGIHDTVLFVGTGEGIWRSDRAGLNYSWQHVLNSTAIYDLHASNDGTIVAGGTGKIFFSTDFGNRWDSVTLDKNYQVRHIVRNSEGAYFASTGILDAELGFTGGGILFCNGSLSQWQQRNNGINFSQPYCDFLTISKSDRLYLSVTNEYKNKQLGLFISDDNGLNWKHVPIQIDGRGTIENEIIIEQTMSISVSPQDSIYISFSGSAGSAGVRLNLVKHNQDLLLPTRWKNMQVFQSNNWWLDRLLLNIHFASNGTWYSSISGSPQIGGTMISNDAGKSWQQIQFGLGLSEFGSHTEQMFYETSYGKMYMVQSIDERIYWTEKSILSPQMIQGKILNQDGEVLTGVMIQAGTIGIVFNDFDGNYTIKVPRGWTGQIVPQLTNFQFSPTEFKVSDISEDLYEINFTGKPKIKFMISGTVTDVFDQKASGVTITGFDTPLITNENGMFQVELDSGWTGTFQATNPSLTFLPTQIVVASLQEDLAEQNFQFRPHGTLIINGLIRHEAGEALAEAYFEGLPREWKINERGNYTIVVPENWTGTIKPQLDPYSFEPESLNIQNLSYDLYDQNFTAFITREFSISGIILDVENQPISNVEISGFGQTVTTDEEGKYHTILPDTWSGTIIPSHPSYDFTPEKITIENISNSLTDQNFTGMLVTQIDDDLQKDNFILYPNPSSDGHFYLRCLRECHDFRFQVFTTTGQLVQEVSTKRHHELTDIYLPERGIFLLKLVTKQKSESIKIVVQR